MNINNRKKLFKKLLFQSYNLGCKEINLIIGQFAKIYLSKLSNSDLRDFEQILQIDDMILYEWYVRKTRVPADRYSKLMSQILDFKPDVNNLI